MTYPLHRADFRVRPLTKHGNPTREFKRVMKIVGLHMQAGGSVTFVDETLYYQDHDHDRRVYPDSDFVSIQLRK